MLEQQLLRLNLLKLQMTLSRNLYGFSFHSPFNWFADSTHKCNRWVDSEEYLIGRFVAKAFSVPVIQFLHNLLDLGRGQLFEVSSFGRVLTDESVGIFIQATFPGMVGLAKETLGLRRLGNRLCSADFLPLSCVSVCTCEDKEWVAFKRAGCDPLSVRCGRDRVFGCGLR